MRAFYYYCREIRITGMVETIIGKEERGSEGRTNDGNNIIY